MAHFVRILFVLFSVIAVSACTGVRLSYESELDETSRTLKLCVGQATEVLAVGNGFPGWWGIYPGITSDNNSVVAIDCQQARSAIPFREPGVIFGGTVCRATGVTEGAAKLLVSSTYGSLENGQDQFDAVVSQCSAE